MTVHFDHSQQRLLKKLAMNWRLTPATLMAHLSSGTWIASPWLQYASAIVAQGIAKGGARIIICAPPRHGKTELISVGTSLWTLENFPKHNVILAAYGADLAEVAGRRVRDMLQDHEAELNAKIRKDVTRVNAFQTESDGYMFSVGLGGAITGRGANVLIIDDYIKEIKEALSPVYRQYVWDWYVTTARTRLEPGASIVIIATRWHSDDLIGRLVTAQPGRWQVIKFPAVADIPEGETDEIGRKHGDPLFPERFPLDALNEIREDLGTLFFDALYQQTPVDESNRVTDGRWLKICDIIPEYRLMKCIRVWDIAATEGGGDYSAGVHCAWEKSTDRFFMSSVIRRQVSPQTLETIVRNTAVSDGLGCHIGIFQEPGAAGVTLCDHFERNVLPEYRVIRIPQTKNKIVRAQPFIAAAEASKIYLLAGQWNRDFVAEFDQFPTGDYDDQVDSAAAGYAHLTGKKIFSASWGAKLSPAVNQYTMDPSQRKRKPLFSVNSATWGSDIQ